MRSNPMTEFIGKGFRYIIVDIEKLIGGGEITSSIIGQKQVVKWEATSWYSWPLCKLCNPRTFLLKAVQFIDISVAFFPFRTVGHWKRDIKNLCKAAWFYCKTNLQSSRMIYCFRMQMSHLSISKFYPQLYLLKQHIFYQPQPASVRLSYVIYHLIFPDDMLLSIP